MSNTKKRHTSGCLICGSPIEYKEEILRECAICHREFVSAAVCTQGHFICDDCHTAELPEFIDYLMESDEKSPYKLLNKIMRMPGVYMHGPEHHIIIPAVLLTCYSNCTEGYNLEMALHLAMERGKDVKGGSCGFSGACGGGIGAGIYGSIVSDSNPLNYEMWAKPNKLTATVLNEIADIGGVRCCKRASFTAIKNAIDWTEEVMGVKLPKDDIKCSFFKNNEECLKNDCPYFPGK